MSVRELAERLAVAAAVDTAALSTDAAIRVVETLHQWLWHPASAFRDFGPHEAASLGQFGLVPRRVAGRLLVEQNDDPVRRLAAHDQRDAATRDAGPHGLGSIHHHGTVSPDLIEYVVTVSQGGDVDAATAKLHAASAAGPQLPRVELDAATVAQLDALYFRAALEAPTRYRTGIRAVLYRFTLARQAEAPARGRVLLELCETLAASMPADARNAYADLTAAARRHLDRIAAG
jgi:hypothetical protein